MFEKCEKIRYVLKNFNIEKTSTNRTHWENTRMNKALALRTEYRLQYWANIAKDCKESGMTNKAFCEARGISEKNYYYWLRRVREAAADSIAPQLIEVKLKNPVQSDILNIRYQEAELMVTKGTSTELLLSTLRALKQL